MSPSIVLSPPDLQTVDVLLIDDEQVIRNLLGEVLSIDHITFRSAENGRTAMSLLRQHRFKLIVTDIHMPDMDGLELIMHCHAHVPHVRILAISGGSHYDRTGVSLKSARLLGSDRTLAKPFSMSDFMETVKEMLSERD